MNIPIAPTTKAVINGSLCDAASGDTREVISPIDRSVIAAIPNCGVEDLNRAVAGARDAFESRHWLGMSPKDRKKVMLKWADLVEAEAETLAALQSRDMGMPIGMARNIDVGSAIDCLRWYGETCDKLYEEMINLEDNVTAQIHRTPLGVIGCILPWNAPAMIGAWKMGPVLASGNSIVVKPAEDATLVCLRIAELALEAGLPEGVLQVVPGRGSVVGAGLASHMDVDCITFTGSGVVGRQIMVAAAESNLKRVSLELGGKSANIVMNDAPNLNMAADVQVGFMFGNMGQVCEAPSRLLIHRSIKDEFIGEVKKRVEALKIGNPLDPDNQMGPIVNEAQRQSIVKFVDQAERDGAHLELDGRKKHVPSEGFYLGATIALVDDPMSNLAQEEVFGPVLTVIAFDTVDEAIKIANSTRYGLGAASGPIAWRR